MSSVLSSLSIAQSTPILHFRLEELVKLDLGWLVQFLDTFRQIKSIIVLRVQLTIQLSQNSMHTIRQAPWSTENPTSFFTVVAKYGQVCLMSWI